MLSDTPLTAANLPNELLIKLFESFELHELLPISQVCIAWREVALSPLIFSSKTLQVRSKNERCMLYDSHKKNLRLSGPYLDYCKESFRSIRRFVSHEAQPQHIQLALKYLPHLTHIQLSQSGLNSKALSSIIHAFSRTLESIDISNNRSVNDAVLDSMSKCRCMKIINLSSCMNFSSGALSALIQQSSLTQLILQKLYNLTEVDLSTLLDALLDNAYHIRFIDLSFNHHLITLTTLERLCGLLDTRHKVLLNVSNCEQLVRKDVEKLEKRYPLASIMHNTVLYDYSVDSIKTYLDFILAN